MVVYLHAGGFTSGDKVGDKGILSWLCSKGYVAVGINYTLRTDTNEASVFIAFIIYKFVLNYPNLKSNPKIDKWYRVTNKGMKSSDGSNYRAFFTFRL